MLSIQRDPFLPIFASENPPHRRVMNSCEHPAVRSSIVIFLGISVLLLALSAVAQEKTPAASHPANSADARLVLHDGWSLQTSAKVEAKGELISTPEFSAEGWHKV